LFIYYRIEELIVVMLLADGPAETNGYEKLPPGRLAFEGPADDGTDNSLFFGDRPDGAAVGATAVVVEVKTT
jgi:hypothetical protein